MTPDVRCPRALDELWPLLDDGFTPMAGGTDLLARCAGRPAAGEGLPDRPGAAPPRAIACLERIGVLRGVALEDGLLRLGACETHARLLRHPLVARHLPVLARALAALGSPPIRTMGTLGGNLATASPAGDTLPPLLVLDAQVELASRQGTRRLPLAGFLLAPGRTALGPGEIVSAVLARVPGPGALQHFEKVGRRKALAIAVVSLAAVLRLDQGGVVEHAALALGSVAPTAVRCPRAEALLSGRRLDRETLLAAGEALRQEIAPIDDLRASADYRRAVAGNLLLRLTA